MKARCFLLGTKVPAGSVSLVSGFINPRRACAARVTGLSVSVSAVKRLTFASVRLEKATTYSTGNEGQNICGDFSEAAPLERSSTYCIVRLPGHFYLRKTRMRIYVYHVVNTRYHFLPCVAGRRRFSWRVS